MSILLAGNHSDVKNELVPAFSDRVEELLALAEGGCDLRALEAAAVCEVLALARLILGYLFALRCQRATEADLKRRGLAPEHVRFRFDEDYWATVATTVGPVQFPWFAYRDLSTGVGNVTRTPARSSVLPYQRNCRSSPLCLEWETRLGMQHPFRRAQDELEFFTHGSVTLEDTTISRHMVQVATLVDREWLYRSAEEIRETLRERATRDRKTRKPIIYASCDAHALRLYVDDTWRSEWKMANGIRLWCEDRNTGEIIHLGGEFTWGDCHEVEKTFQALIDRGLLPGDGNYGGGLRAQLVWISDAMRWFDDHILKLFVDVIVILDIFHLLGWFASCAAKTFGAGTKAARQLYARAAKILGFDRGKPEQPKPRKGHKKHHRDRNRHAHNSAAVRFKKSYKGAMQLVTALFDVLAPLKPTRDEGKEAIEALAKRISNNVLRMDYPEYLRRGYQIGSGAMESLHRTGSQQRTKVPGARWLESSSQAIFNLRMLHLVGKWNEFWDRPDITYQLARAFIPETVGKRVRADGV